MGGDCPSQTRDAVTLALFLRPHETADRIPGQPPLVAVREVEPIRAPDPSSFMALHRRMTEEFHTTSFDIAPDAGKPLTPLSARDSFIQ